MCICHKSYERKIKGNGMTKCNNKRFDSDSTSQVIMCSQTTADMVKFTLQDIMMISNHTCNKICTSVACHSICEIKVTATLEITQHKDMSHVFKMVDQLLFIAKAKQIQ